MSTAFNVREWASQAGITTTGGFAVVAECVTLEELERFAHIAMEKAVYQLEKNHKEYMDRWEAAYNAVCDERDAIVKDSDKAFELLRMAETEMRYAEWGTRLNDQHGRTDVYEAILEFLK